MGVGEVMVGRKMAGEGAEEVAGLDAAAPRNQQGAGEQYPCCFLSLARSNVPSYLSVRACPRQWK